MALLFVDTAMNACTAAVQDKGAVTVRSAPMQRGQAEMLVPFMAEAMAAAGVDFEALEAVAVTVGPGTFTGLRVGMAAAKGVALARGVPVIGLTTLEIIAAGMAAIAAGREILVVIESKRSDVYVQVFDARGRAIEAPAAMEVADVAAAFAGRRLLVGGDVVERLRRDMAAAGLEWPAGWEAREIVCPDAGAALSLARERLGQGAVEMPEPVYLRPADVSRPKIKRVIEG